MFDYCCKLEAGRFYHVYNRGNNSDTIFYNKGNYAYFLRKYDEYLSDFVETYCFCLLPNHFHLLVRVKENLTNPARVLNLESDATFLKGGITTPTKVPNFLKESDVPFLKGDITTPTKVPNFLKENDATFLKGGITVSEQFRRFFTGYSMAINKQQNRHGSLFEKPFKRIEVNSIQYLQNIVFYIHANPQLHGFTNDYINYTWSSYKRILIDKPSKLFKKEVLEWFVDKENYINYHSQKIDIEIIKNLIIE
ncbi:MAG: hypothetical protein A2046_06365 [Bacteroidetes bacterium GWA2_30_7]|nr:MAG: hypothetical protein A2046_06365 [Bacteroidetes bacterium GWA2_30_7]